MTTVIDNGTLQTQLGALNVFSEAAGAAFSVAQVDGKPFFVFNVRGPQADQLNNMINDSNPGVKTTAGNDSPFGVVPFTSMYSSEGKGAGELTVMVNPKDLAGLTVSMTAEKDMHQLAIAAVSKSTHAVSGGHAAEPDPKHGVTVANNARGKSEPTPT